MHRSYSLQTTWGAYAAEACLGVLAILDIIIIFALRQPEPEPVEPPSISHLRKHPSSPHYLSKKPQIIWRKLAINEYKITIIIYPNPQKSDSNMIQN